MRILSSRLHDITPDRHAGRISATVHLLVLIDGLERDLTVRTSAPITAPGAARLKDRLIASAKLMVAMRADRNHLPDAPLAA
jgi:hypothetical protein